MKIAFLHFTSGLIDRGSEISTKTLADYLTRKGHKVYLYQLGEVKGKTNYQLIQVKLPLKPHLFKSTTTLGTVLERLYLDYNSLVILLFSLSASLQLLKVKPDIIVPTNGFWQIIVCRLVRWLKKSKIVIFGRAGIGFHDKDNLGLKADLFIALTKTAEKWAKEINNKINICYIPNGINCEFYNPNKKPLIRKNLPIILTVAALTKYKRIDLVIRAVSKMSTKNFLMIIGKGELQAELTKLGRQLLGNNFSLSVFPMELMPQIYTSCNVFTLASDKQDAFPRVLLEALASGRNIVASDDPIKKEIINGAGLLVNPQDEIAYAQALEKSLKINYQRKALVRAKHYDLERVGYLLDKKLNEIIKR